MKPNIFALFLICSLGLYSNAAAQQYFNRSYLEGLLPKLIFCDLKAIGSNKLVASGFSVNKDNMPGGHLTFVDSLGMVTRFCDYIGKIPSSSTWWDESLLVNNANEFVIAANTSRNDSIFITIFLTDSVCGILKKVEYPSLYVKNNKFLTPTCIIGDGKKGYYCSATIVNTPSPDLDLQLTRLDSNLNIIWSKAYGIKGKEDGLLSMLLTPDQNVRLCGALQFGNLPLTTFEAIYDIDSNGTLLNRMISQSSDSLFFTLDCIFEPRDSSYIFASQAPVIGPSLYTDFYPLIYKRDKTGKIVWKTKMGNGQYNGSSMAQKVVGSFENDGYILVGSLERLDFNDEYISRNYGFIGKVSLNGDSLWMRQYAHIDGKTDSTTFSDNLYDVLKLNDSYYLGGYVFGPRPHSGYTGNLQAAWLMRVDKFGCLVPGCHLPSSLPVIEAIDLHYKVFPNPAHADLNIFVDDTKGNDLTIRFCDALGVPLKSIQHRGAATTYILPLQSYASGTYIVQFWQDGRLVKGEKVVVAR